MPRSSKKLSATSDNAVLRNAMLERFAARLPGNRNASELPKLLDQDTASKLFKDAYGVSISPRTLERWDLPSRRINGRKAIEIEDFAAEAERRLDAAPKIQAGRPAPRKDSQNGQQALT